MLEWIALFRRADFEFDEGTATSTMLSLCRDHCVQFFDQLSADVRFDAVIATFNVRERDGAKATDDGLPAFWSFLISTLRAESATTVNAQSASIRILTRWTKRCLQRGTTNLNSNEDAKENLKESVEFEGERVVATLIRRHFGGI